MDSKKSTLSIGEISNLSNCRAKAQLLRKRKVEAAGQSLSITFFFALDLISRQTCIMDISPLRTISHARTLPLLGLLAGASV